MDDLRHSARQAGMSSDNLEDVFLSIVEQDNADRSRGQSYEGLVIELRKEKRTGVIPALLAVGILGAAYAFVVNFLVRIRCSIFRWPRWTYC